MQWQLSRGQEDHPLPPPMGGMIGYLSKPVVKATAIPISKSQVELLLDGTSRRGEWNRIQKQTVIVVRISLMKQIPFIIGWTAAEVRSSDRGGSAEGTQLSGHFGRLLAKLADHKAKVADRIYCECILGHSEPNEQHKGRLEEYELVKAEVTVASMWIQDLGQETEESGPPSGRHCGADAGVAQERAEAFFLVRQGRKGPFQPSYPGQEPNKSNACS
ncbi:hypothetical protein DFH06DRAFT_1298336 [Mycena polygramma]|nr:hypothetical protein DFH06DRAFT_1298336 [Mycena polygramma]